MLSTSLIVSIIGTASTAIGAIGYGCIQSHKVVKRSGYPGCRCCCLSIGLHCGQDECGRPELEMTITPIQPPEQMTIMNSLKNQPSEIPIN